MIFYFSGTDNSLWVTKTISTDFNDSRIIEMGSSVVSGQPLNYNVEQNERIGFIFPVHSWGIPWIVRKFIEQLNIENLGNNLIYCILTCGDDCGYTDRMFNKLMQGKGWKCRHIYSVQMPNTYVVFPGFDTDPEDLEQKKKDEAKSTLPRIEQAINTDTPINCYLMKGHPFLKSRIIYPLFCKFKMSSKPFYTTKRCNGCGLCAKRCPTHNINIVDGRPQWGDCCTQCLSCLHHCPTESIEYGKQSVGKGRYFYYKKR